jgi:transcriptional regulator with XRE-family HTH domain
MRWNESVYLRALRGHHPNGIPLTHSELARRLGVSYVTLCRWRRGECRPSWEHLEALGRELDLDWKKIIE